jgi:hypothetical protein
MEPQVVVLAGVHDTDRLVSVLNSYLDEEALRQELRQLARWVILTRGDAQFLEVDSVSTEAEAEIRRCCEAADSAVRRVEWFREVMPRLSWYEPEQCYALTGRLPIGRQG